MHGLPGLHVHPRRPAVLDHDAMHQRPGDDPQVRPPLHRIEVADGRAAPPPVARRKLEVARPLLGGAVEVVVARDADLLGGGDVGVADVAPHAHVGHRERAADPVERILAPLLVLGAAEERQHVVIGPAGAAELPPLVVVLRLAAHIQQAVDRARPAQHPAARPLQPPPVQARVRLGRHAPVGARVVHGLEVADRDVDPDVAVRRSRLDQQHPAGRVGGQAVGQHAPCRPRADDDVVEHGTIKAAAHGRAQPTAAKAGASCQTRKTAVTETLPRRPAHPAGSAASP